MLRIQQVRIQAGYTQKQVAEYLGIHPNSYQRIEYGTRKGSVETWDKLEDLFHVPQRDLRLIE